MLFLCNVFLCFVTITYGVLGQLRYFIVSFPDIGLLPYFGTCSRGCSIDSIVTSQVRMKYILLINVTVGILPFIGLINVIVGVVLKPRIVILPLNVHYILAVPFLLDYLGPIEAQIDLFLALTICET